MRARWAFLGLVLLAARATAQPAAPLTVLRTPGAESCPDAAALLDDVARIRHAAVPDDQPAYRVTFTREPSSLRAEIVREDTSSHRVLTDAAADCGALAQATAVTLALLFDAQSAAPPAPQPTPAVHEPVPVQVPVHAPARPSDRLRSSLALGPGALLGVTRPVTPAFLIELDLRSTFLRATLAAVYAPPLSRDFAAGEVRESLAGGALHACVAPLREPRSVPAWRIDLCAGALLGALHASATGFDDNGASTRFWSALAIDARVSRTPSPLGAELALSLLIPVRRQDFRIDNAGVAYASSPVALLVTLRGAVGWAW